MAYVFLGLSLLIGGILAVRWFAGADPKTLARVARVVLGLVAVVGLILFLASGQLGLAVMAIGALLPMLLRWRTLARLARTTGGPRPGQESTIETRFLRMSLDHDTGVMTGIVLEGVHRGRGLHELHQANLLDLLRECRVADAESASVLEAYLDRTQQEDWRQAAGETGEGRAAGEGGAASPSAAMTRNEAYRVLGLEEGAGVDAIKAAHRRLMRQLHPDHGGSTWIAAKINQAKDLLLKS
ncbi:MAG: molecular chaperone DnaJ [Alphaproteobacteria bacterium]|nr:molecular chaperone DnaJ [Alphaproteobacteria bacterium]